MAIIIFATFFSSILVIHDHAKDQQIIQTKENLSSIMIQLKTNINNQYNALENTIYALSSNISNSGILRDTNAFGYRTFQDLEKFRVFFNALSSIHTRLKFLIISNENILVSNYDYSELGKYPRPTELDKQLLSEAKKYPVFLEQVNFFNESYVEEQKLISFAYPIFTISDLYVAGNIILDIPSSVLDEYLALLKMDKNQGFIIHGSLEKPNIIYATEEGTNIDNIDLSALQKTPILKDEKIWCMEPLGYDFYLIGNTKLVEPGIPIFSSITFPLIILLVSMILISIFYLFSVNRPINDIIKGFENLGKRNYGMKLKELRSSKEISSLYDSLYILRDEIVENNLRIKGETKLKERAQLTMLQQQINPHFLFNSLESIIGFSWAEEPEKVEAIGMNLSRLLRYNLYWDSPESTLEKEYNLCQNYIDIIRTEYEGRFSFQGSIEEQLKDVKCLRFILQPIVENSLKHGFEASDQQDFKLSVSIKKNDEKHIWITIFNNGTSFKDNKRLELLEKMDTLKNDWKRGIPITTSSREKIGMLNVYKRLLLTYGEDISINISRENENGTTIIMSFPSNYKGTDL